MKKYQITLTCVGNVFIKSIFYETLESSSSAMHKIMREVNDEKTFVYFPSISNNATFVNISNIISVELSEGLK